MQNSPSIGKSISLTSKISMMP